ncbi:hypothetical protein MKEN_00989700 [Mycena kentingensis (nom. inval.)]|nr:hypothetical protein MKEN_00989700 [Mycena kentingensis (nom. inval.)]
MILTEELRSDKGVLALSDSTSTHSPTPSYPSRASFPSSSSSSSPSTLQPPPLWTTMQSNASDGALTLPRSHRHPSMADYPGALARSRSASAVYLPHAGTDIVGPVQSASFTRIPNLPSKQMPAFPPVFLLADDNSLRKGFPVIPPPSEQQPHPFEVHDVLEADWRNFLDEMRTAASLTTKDRRMAYCVPVLSILPFINTAVAAAIKHHIRGKKPALVSLLVDKWNHLFFHRRRLEVILMRGQTRLSGQSDKPVPGLHTPKTVNFTAPPVAGADSGKDAEKTWRLFVVSMDA